MGFVSTGAHSVSARTMGRLVEQAIASCLSCVRDLVKLCVTAGRWVAVLLALGALDRR